MAERDSRGRFVGGGKKGGRTSADFSIEIRNLGPMADRLKNELPQAFQNAMFSGIQAGAIHLQSEIKILLEGPVLERRTGRLWRSIQPEVFKRGGTVVGVVGTDVEYAPVHEFGATIRPKRAGGFLVFEQGGETRFAREVKIPRRPYMARAFREQKGKVFRIIRDTVLAHAQIAFGGSSPGGSILPASQRAGVTSARNHFSISPRTRL